MSYTQVDECVGGKWRSVGIETAGTTATITLKPVATGQTHKINSISFSCPSATILNIKVVKNDGTTVLDQFDWAGTANSLQPGQTLLNYGVPGLPCANNDSAKIIITNTGSGVIVCSAVYDMVP